MPAEKSAYASREKAANAGSTSLPYSAADKLKKSNVHESSGKNSGASSPSKQKGQHSSLQSLSPSKASASKDAHPGSANSPNKAQAHNKPCGDGAHGHNSGKTNPSLLSNQSHSRQQSPSVQQLSPRQKSASSSVDKHAKSSQSLKAALSPNSGARAGSPSTKNSGHSASPTRSSDRANKSSASPSREREIGVKRAYQKIATEITHHGEKIQRSFLENHIVPRIKHSPIVTEGSKSPSSSTRLVASPVHGTISPRKEATQKTGTGSDGRRSASPPPQAVAQQHAANIKQRAGSPSTSAASPNRGGGSPSGASAGKATGSPIKHGGGALSPSSALQKQGAVHGSGTNISLARGPAAASPVGDKSANKGSVSPQSSAAKLNAVSSIQQKDQHAPASSSPKTGSNPALQKVPPSISGQKQQTGAGDARRAHQGQGPSPGGAGSGSRAHK